MMRSYTAGTITVTCENAESDEARSCLAGYYRELAKRFDNGFDPLAANNFDPAEMTPPKGWFLLARKNGQAVGCGVLKRLDEATGEIKRLWIAPTARGLGVATLLMDRLEAQAHQAGFARVVLDTNRTLTEAQALYARRGYAETGPYNDNPYADHWYEKRL